MLWVPTFALGVVVRDLRLLESGIGSEGDPSIKVSTADVVSALVVYGFVSKNHHQVWE